MLELRCFVMTVINFSRRKEDAGKYSQLLLVPVGSHRSGKRWGLARWHLKLHCKCRRVTEKWAAVCSTAISQSVRGKSLGLSAAPTAHLQKAAWVGFSLFYWWTYCCYKKARLPVQEPEYWFSTEQAHWLWPKANCERMSMELEHFIDYSPSLLVLSITWRDSLQRPLQEGWRLTSLCQNLPSILTHLWEDSAGMANVVDSWLPSATEQLKGTHTDTSASPVYVSSVGCTFSLMYQAGITR